MHVNFKQMTGSKHWKILGDGAIGVCYTFLSIFITFKFLKNRKK